jgi:hypothetical protein
MGTDADSMVWEISCDDHSSRFRVGLPLVGGFESKRLVPIIALKLCHVKSYNTKNTLYFMHKCKNKASGRNQQILIIWAIFTIGS